MRLQSSRVCLLLRLGYRALDSTQEILRASATEVWILALISEVLARLTTAVLPGASTRAISPR
jgi:hypothetical protein